VISVLSATLSGKAEDRNAATAEIQRLQNSVEQAPGYPTALLSISLTNPRPDIRASAAVQLKNCVRACWDVRKAEHTVAESEKEQIRASIFEAMLQSKGSVQRCLAETIVMIAATDFPHHWPAIAADMVKEMSATDLSRVEAALSTAHSVFTRYRKVDELTVELREELLTLFALYIPPLHTTLMRLCEWLSADPNPEVCRCLTFGLLSLQDLIKVDMAKELEVRLRDFMNVCYSILVYQNAQLTGTAERGPLVELQSTILELLIHFIQQFDDDFEPFAVTFLEAVVRLLSSPEAQLVSMDDLVVTGLEYVSAATRSIAQNAFQQPKFIEQLCSTIVLPNLLLQPADEEMFEDEPESYVQREIDGSDGHTRRNSALELVRSLFAAFPDAAGPIFLQTLNNLLTGYEPKWKGKDAALTLVTALVLEGVSNTQRGAKDTLNPIINFGEFLEQYVLHELASDVAPPSHAILKATIIKFMTTFRGHIPNHFLEGTLQCLITWTGHSSLVLHSLAANSIERYLSHRFTSGQLLVPEQAFSPLGPALLDKLCSRLRETKRPNEYTMRCLMRVSSHTSLIAQFVGDVVGALAQVLEETVKNPSNPMFTYCLFECLSSAVTAGSAQVSAIESTLWEHLMKVLATDVVEMVPYTLQLLSQILDTKPPGQLEPIYQQLAPPLLSTVLYEKPMNIPAVVRLLTAIIHKDAGYLHAHGYTERVLGVFKQLTALKQYDHEGFNVVTAVMLYYPLHALEPFLTSIFRVLFERLQKAKTAKYVRCLIIFFSVICVVHSPEVVVTRIDGIQPGLFYMLLQRVWLENMQKIVGQMERKTCIVALANLLCDSAHLQMNVEAWCGSVFSCLKMIHCAVEAEEDKSFIPDSSSSWESLARDTMQESAASYCPLKGCAPAPIDPAPQIQDSNSYFKSKMMALLHGPNGASYTEALRRTLSPDLFALVHP